MAEIPQFSLTESEEIGVMLGDAGISYEQSVSASGRGYVGFLFSVPDDRLADAVQVIKSYYGFLDAPAEAVSGTCPACGATVNNALECPDCGLTLSFDPRDSMRNHPFTVFLEKLEKTGELVRR
ncbi:MAG: hypothetical protein WC334_04125 [Kiritimatiellales bacterium]|jgi:hypothetical protein